MAGYRETGKRKKKKKKKQNIILFLMRDCLVGGEEDKKGETKRTPGLLSNSKYVPHTSNISKLDFI
jgi:hypothetical protein